jgi:Phosphotransferase enzyme family
LIAGSRSPVPRLVHTVGVEEEEPLLGGNVGSVVRVGNTVRRSTGPWMDVVHELLRHLEHVGFAYSPRVLGTDDQGREVLSFIEGETVGATHPWPAWAWADETLVQAGRILRECHEAVRDFRPRGSRTWRLTTAAVTNEEVVCHNDIAPYNLVFQDGRIVGIIDWDLASPAMPSWDLAWSAWTFAPIHTPDHATRLGAPLDIARRMRLMCDSYGLQERDGFLDVIKERMLASIVGIETQAAAGDEAFARLIKEGHVDRMRDDADWLADHGSEWTAALS